MLAAEPISAIVITSLLLSGPVQVTSKSAPAATSAGASRVAEAATEVNASLLAITLDPPSGKSTKNLASSSATSIGIVISTLP